jgi:hypothetical protein
MRDLKNGMPCQNGTDCLSGVCVSNKCVGRELGQSCVNDTGVVTPGMCDSGQCEGTPPVCVAQTCSPVCGYGDICLGSGNRCSPSTGSFNGEACYTGDRDCLSIKCNLQSNTCDGRSDGSFCTMNEQCNPGSSCQSGVCQPTGSTCPPCQVGQKCVSGTCTNVLLSAKDSCTKNADCASGFCDAGPRNYWTCRAGQACTPTYPSANTVACGTPVLPNNGCGSTQNGTGTFCASGTCNGTSCVTPATNFTVTAPASMTVTQGTSGGVTVTVATTDNTAKTVVLTSSGSPANVTASFNPSSVTVNNSSTTSTFTVSVASTVPVGAYTLTLTGTVGSDVRTTTVTLNVVSTGGTGLPNGSSCTQNSQCSSNNCGPKFEANKTCNGTIDYNQTATVATDCHSGRFITGTNRCGPDQFIGCATSSAFTTFQFFSTAGATRNVQVGGAGRCVVSDPTRDETSASENGDIVCTQQTFWTDASVACLIKVGGARTAIWNTGKP